jgi:hypothetical protein
MRTRGPRRERWRSAWPSVGRAHRLLGLVAHRLKPHAESFERLCCDSFSLGDQSQEDVLSADEGVIEQTGFLLGEDEDPPSSVGETLKHLAHDNGCRPRPSVTKRSSLSDGWRLAGHDTDSPRPQTVKEQPSSANGSLGTFLCRSPNARERSFVRHARWPDPASWRGLPEVPLGPGAFTWRTPRSV